MEWLPVFTAAMPETVPPPPPPPGGKGLVLHATVLSPPPPPRQTQAAKARKTLPPAADPRPLPSKSARSGTVGGGLPLIVERFIFISAIFSD